MQNSSENGAATSDERFVAYYAKLSLSESAILRFESIKDAVLRLRASQGQLLANLQVADIGCNTGTQCRIWARDGHNVQGVDIAIELIDIAQERAKAEGLSICFHKGSATSLPWDDGIFDVCLMPELLEHVEDWQACLAEACRVVRPGGVLYLSTTNLLCPVQQEFNLPGYSWYPGFLKKRFEKASITNRPELVNFATFPALHWFTFNQLRNFISDHGLVSFDRFDMIDESQKGWLAGGVVKLLRSVPFIRFFGHVATPYTVVFAIRPDC